MHEHGEGSMQHANALMRAIKSSREQEDTHLHMSRLKQCIGYLDSLDMGGKKHLKLMDDWIEQAHLAIDDGDVCISRRGYDRNHSNDTPPSSESDSEDSTKSKGSTGHCGGREVAAPGGNSEQSRAVTEWLAMLDHRVDATIQKHDHESEKSFRAWRAKANALGKAKCFHEQLAALYEAEIIARLPSKAGSWAISDTIEDTRDALENLGDFEGAIQRQKELMQLDAEQARSSHTRPL